MEHAEFRQFWNSDEFNNLIDRVIALYKPISVTKNVTMQVGANDLVRDMRGTSEPYDGVLEYVFESGADLVQLSGSDLAVQLNDEMQAYQAQFVELSESSAFFTEYQSPKVL